MSLIKGFWLEWRVFQSCTLEETILLQLHNWQQADIEQALSSGFIEVNAIPINSLNLLLKIHDTVRVYLSSHRENAFSSEWTILHEWHDILAVHKPAQLPVSRTTQNLFGTLISLVRRQTENVDAHLLHRLDAETSGIMLLAKYSRADQRWKKNLDKLIERKIYHAVVRGNPEWNEYLAEDWLAELPNSAIRTQMHIVSDQQVPTIKAPKLACTQFKVLRRLGDFTLLECELFTGRKHQIRAQIAHLGYPIVGDKIYSFNGEYYLKRLNQDLTATDFLALGADHHLLHAYELRVNIRKEVITLTDNQYPKAWQSYLAL